MTSIELGQLALFFAMSISLNVCYMIWRTIIFGAASGLVWFLFGAFMYSLGTGLDLWQLTGIFIGFLSMFVWFDVFTSYRTEKREELEEQLAENEDDLLDKLENAIDNDDKQAQRTIRRKLNNLEYNRSEKIGVVKEVRRGRNSRKARDFSDTGRI